MSLQTPPAAPAHPVSSVAKAPARQSGHNGQGNGNGGVSPFAQLLQGMSDDATPDTSGPAAQADDACAQDDTADKPAAEHATAHKAHEKAAQSADDATPTPQQPAATEADTMPATARAASLGQASLLAAARAKAGAEARSRHGSLADVAGADRAAGPGHLTGKDVPLTAAADHNPNSIDISGFKPTLDAATVNLAAAEPAVAGAAADFSLPSLGAATTAAAPTPEATPAQATLTPPPGSAAFPAALGAQLNTWLKDGVQYASLELNPQDMGPINVRIALRDGRTQVELGAEVAATRQALTEALPTLADALGDVGLSLTGGSVSDQAGQQARQGDAEAQRAFTLPGWLAPARDGDASPAASAAPQRAQRGLIDLVA